MKISLNWLRDFVDLPKNITPQELGEKLSLHVVEVEGFEREADLFENMVVGKVVTIEKHPNADRLSVCVVDAGSAGKKLNIVCGGKNLREGMLVAVALPGANVKWHGEGDLVELKEAEVRGVKSFGMICAGGEIGLEDMQARQPVVGDGPHILDISDIRAKPGTSLAQALGKDDVVFEISNVSLSNRPDLWSHYGIARELAVVYDRTLKPIKFAWPTPRKRSVTPFLNVKVIAKDLCPRYVGTLVENVHIAKTPEWMVKRLLAVGQRSISPLVDISNYVMFEMGQPVHIFDSHKVIKSLSQKAEIVVRKAKHSEKLKMLDGVERTLDEEILVIADAEKPVAIAGVMGGEDSGVSEKTNSIIIECATFDPVSVRRTSAKLGMKTDAAQRFEKSLDPHLPMNATARVWQLLQECADEGATPVVRSVVDVSAKLPTPKPIKLSLEMLDHRIGTPVSRTDAKKILLGLGFTVHPVRGRSAKGTASAALGRLTSNGVKEWKVTPPSWRATRDISIPEDLVEEIGRHLDYNTIPDALPSYPIAPPPVAAHQRLERALKQFLAGAGFYEVEHKPFLNPQEWERFGLEQGAHVEVLNPVDPQARYLRQSLLPGLFNDIRINRNEAERLRFFEWGRIFIPKDGEYAVKKNAKEHLPHQPVTLSFVIAETIEAEEMLRRIKGMALKALQAAGFQGETKIASEERLAFRTETFFSLFADGVCVGGGSMGSELLKAELGLAGRQNIGAASMNIDVLARVTPSVSKYAPLPSYPSIQRDLAIVVDEAVHYAEIEKTVRSAAGPLVESLELFDVFRGEGIPQGKKSLALRLTFRAGERTLKSGEIDTIMSAVEKRLAISVDASIRE